MTVQFNDNLQQTYIRRKLSCIRAVLVFLDTGARILRRVRQVQNTLGQYLSIIIRYTDRMPAPLYIEKGKPPHAVCCRFLHITVEPHLSSRVRRTVGIYDLAGQVQRLRVLIPRGQQYRIDNLPGGLWHGIPAEHITDQPGCRKCKECQHGKHFYPCSLS